MTTQALIAADLQESINKNLPQAVGEELQKVLAQGQEDAKKVANLSSRLENLQAEFRAANARLDEHGNITKRVAELVEREKKLAAREQAFLEEKANLRAVVAEAKFQVLDNVFTSLFKNTIIRENISSMVAVPVAATPPNQYNNCGSPAMVQQHSENQFKEISKE